MTLSHIKDHAHRIRTGDFSASSGPPSLSTSTSAASTPSTTSTLTPDRLSSFAPVQRVSILPNTYTHPKKILGRTSESTPRTEWLVSRCPQTQDLLIRDLRTVPDSEASTLSPDDADQDAAGEVKYKPNTGKPEGVLPLPLVVLYLYVTRRSHGFRLRNIGAAGLEGAEYDLTNAVRVGEGVVEDKAEREFWRHVGRAEGVGLWTARGGGGVRVRVRAAVG